MINTYPAAYSNNQWVEVNHATQIQSLTSPPVTSTVNQNKKKTMMTMIISMIMITLMLVWVMQIWNVGH